MSALLIPGVPKTFAQMLGRHPETIGKAVRAFEREVTRSLIADGVPPDRVTHAELKRRFDACVKVVMILVGDMHWGVERALGHLGEYLRKELGGETWEPSTRASWIPQGGEGES